MNLLNPQSLLRWFGFTALVMSPLVSTSAAADPPTSIEIAWDAVPGSDVQGYKVYVGTSSGQYSESYDAGLNLSVAVPDLVWGTTYFFAVKAIGSTGLESDYSEEIVVTIATPPLPTGGEITMAASGQLAMNWSFPTAALSSAPDFIIEQSSDLVNWTVAATVGAWSYSGGTTESVNFSWPVAVSGSRKFYRLTAKNWLGTSRMP